MGILGCNDVADDDWRRKGMSFRADPFLWLEVSNASACSRYQSAVALPGLSTGSGACLIPNSNGTENVAPWPNFDRIPTKGINILRDRLTSFAWLLRTRDVLPCYAVSKAFFQRLPGASHSDHKD